MVLQGTLLREDYAALWQAKQKGRRGRSIVLGVLLVVLAMGFCGYALSLLLGGTFNVSTLISMALCATPGVLLLRQQTFGYACRVVDLQRRNELLRPAQFGAVTVTLYADRVVVQTAQAREEIHLAEIVRIEPTKTSFFFTTYTNNHSVLLPANAFASLAARDVCMTQMRVCWQAARVSAAPDTAMVCALPANIVTTLPYTLTQDEFINGMVAATQVLGERFHARRRGIIIALLGAALLLAGVAYLGRNLFLSVVFFGGGALLWLLALSVLVPAMNRRLYRYRLLRTHIYTQLLRPVTLHVCKDRLATQRALAYSEYLLGDVTGTVWTDTMLCLLLRGNLVVLIPRRAFTSEAQLQSVLDVLNAERPAHAPPVSPAP